MAWPRLAKYPRYCPASLSSCTPCTGPRRSNWRPKKSECERSSRSRIASCCFPSSSSCLPPNHRSRLARSPARWIFRRQHPPLPRRRRPSNPAKSLLPILLRPRPLGPVRSQEIVQRTDAPVVQVGQFHYPSIIEDYSTPRQFPQNETNLLRLLEAGRNVITTLSTAPPNLR